MRRANKQRIDLREWNLESMRGVERAILDCASEALELAMSDSLTGLYFPGRLKDPLTVDLHVALQGTADDDVVAFRLDLREALRSEIECCLEDGSYASKLHRIATALRRFADELDETVRSAGGGGGEP